MVIHHPRRLHVRVADRRAYELEAAGNEVLAECIRLRRLGRQVGHAPAMIHDRRAIHKAPDVRVERTECLLHAQKGLGIGDGTLYLAAVPDDAGIGHDALDVARTEAGDGTDEIQNGSNISRSGSNITLQPGAYYIAAFAKWGWNIPDWNQGYQSGFISAKTQLRVRDIGTNSTLLVSDGTNVFKSYPVSVGANVYDQYTLQVAGVINIPSASTIALQQFIDYTTNTVNGATYNSGKPVSTGENEIYSRVLIQKIQ